MCNLWPSSLQCIQMLNQVLLMWACHMLTQLIHCILKKQIPVSSENKLLCEDRVPLDKKYSQFFPQRFWCYSDMEREIHWKDSYVGKKLMSSGIHLWYRFWTANLLTLSSIINETVHYLELEWEINSSLSKMEFSQPLQSGTAAPREHTHTHTHTQRTRQKCSPCPIHQGSTTLPCPIRSRSADLILHPLD